MAILLARFAWDPDNGGDPHWLRLRDRAIARARGRVDELQAPGANALAITSRERAPPALQQLPGGEILLADCERPCVSAELRARPQDSPAAVIVLDPRERRVRLLRDRMGQRPLLWARVPGALLVASGENILRAHPAVDSAFDPDYLAAYFGACAPPATATAWRAIRSLAPGEMLDIDIANERSSRLTSEPLAEAFSWSDARASDEFAERLRAAVQTSCAGAGRIGLTLSSGLDSGAIASLLPGVPAATGANRKPLAVTYGCADVPGPDERTSAAALAHHCGLEHYAFIADELGPLSTREPIETSPDTPISNPYRALKTHAYGRFHAAGVDVVLSGNFSDHLVCDPGHWLVDALAGHRYAMIAGNYARLLLTAGPRALWRERGWRSWLRPPAATLHVAHWLRPQIALALRERLAGEQLTTGAWPRPRQAAHALGSYAAFDAAGECFFAQRFGLEVRHPWRDWPLVQLALSLAGHQSWRAGRGKIVQRAALQGQLPARWRTRQKTASMQPLYEHSLFGRARPRLLSLIESSRPAWEPYVEPAAVRRCLQQTVHSDSGALLPWLLAGFTCWLETID